MSFSYNYDGYDPEVYDLWCGNAELVWEHTAGACCAGVSGGGVSVRVLRSVFKEGDISLSRVLILQPYTFYTC
jgi:hypothetical protein